MPSFSKLSHSLSIAAKGAVLVGATAAMAACNDTTSPSEPSGAVRFVNAAPGQATVNLTVDGTLALPLIPFGDGNAILVGSSTTARTFKAFNATGTTELATRDIVIETDKAYSLVLAQTAVGVTTTNFLYFPDTVSAPAATMAKVRVVNTSPATPTFDLYVLATGGDLATATPLQTVAYGESSLYYQVAAGNKRIVITSTGTKTILTEITSLSFPEGRATTIITLNATGATPITTLYWNDL